MTPLTKKQMAGEIARRGFEMDTRATYRAGGLNRFSLLARRPGSAIIVSACTEIEAYRAVLEHVRSCVQPPRSDDGIDP